MRIRTSPQVTPGSTYPHPTLPIPIPCNTNPKSRSCLECESVSTKSRPAYHFLEDEYTKDVAANDDKVEVRHIIDNQYK